MTGLAIQSAFSRLNDFSFDPAAKRASCSRLQGLPVPVGTLNEW